MENFIEDIISFWSLQVKSLILMDRLIIAQRV